MAVLNKHKCGIPNGAIYIGRGSKWGNPFVISNMYSRDRVVELYKEKLWKDVQSGTVKLEDLANLKGKDLVCFCAPLACHGDVLELAADWATEQLKNQQPQFNLEL